MKNKTDYLRTLYIYEQNLLKSTVDILIESSSEIVHDNILSMFDNIDEVNRKIYNYLFSQGIIRKDSITKKKREDLYEELDCLLIGINE